ncbi:hypothetical protein J6590_055422 [Homalodisca vitripennis]|nr:hypothetical protein J6590_055422 [Homalodisca vitripennis]
MLLAAKSFIPPCQAYVHNAVRRRYLETTIARTEHLANSVDLTLGNHARARSRARVNTKQSVDQSVRSASWLMTG